MADYICPDTREPCGEFPSLWCTGCQCPGAIAAEIRAARMALDPLPKATFSTAYHQDGYGVPAYTADEMLAYGADVRSRCVGPNVKGNLQ